MGAACTEFADAGGWHFDNGAISKFDDVLLELGGLPHVLPLAVQLDFTEVLKYRGDYSKMFLLFEYCCGTPPSCLEHFSVSLSPFWF